MQKKEKGWSPAGRYDPAKKTPFFAMEISFLLTGPFNG
jgi:hypothetical protein